MSQKKFRVGSKKVGSVGFRKRDIYFFGLIKIWTKTRVWLLWRKTKKKVHKKKTGWTYKVWDLQWFSFISQNSDTLLENSHRIKASLLLHGISLACAILLTLGKLQLDSQYNMVTSLAFLYPALFWLDKHVVTLAVTGLSTGLMAKLFIGKYRYITKEKKKQAWLSSSVGCASDWYSGGHGFDPPVGQHSFVEIGHEIISTAILSLPLIQVGQVSVTGERIYTKYWLTA